MIDTFIDNILNDKYVDNEDSSDKETIISQDNIVEDVVKIINDNTNDGVEKSP